MTLPPELLGHFKGNQSAKGPASQQIRPPRLNRLDRLDVEPCQTLNTGVRLAFAIKPWRFQPIEWLIGAKMLRQWSEREDIATGRMNTEEWTPGTARLNWHQ